MCFSFYFEKKIIQSHYWHLEKEIFGVFHFISDLIVAIKTFILERKKKIEKLSQNLLYYTANVFFCQNFSKLIQSGSLLQHHLLFIKCSTLGSSTYDVTLFWTILDTLTTVVPSSQNPWSSHTLMSWRHLWTTPFAIFHVESGIQDFHH